MELDKPRVEKIVSSITSNPIVRRYLRNFFGSAEGSKTFLELGKTKEYICYVLKCQPAGETGEITAGGRAASVRGGVGSQMGGNHCQQAS